MARRVRWRPCRRHGIDRRRPHVRWRRKRVFRCARYALGRAPVAIRNRRRRQCPADSLLGKRRRIRSCCIGRQSTTRDTHAYELAACYAGVSRLTLVRSANKPLEGAASRLGLGIVMTGSVTKLHCFCVLHNLLAVRGGNALRLLSRILSLAFLIALASCSGGAVPNVHDYTSGTPTRHVNPQSVVARCPPDQPNCVGGGGGGCGGGGGTGDPLQYIHCPGATSCAGSANYSIGQPIQCVTYSGYPTTGCGGDPESNGVGIGVFYSSAWTCYLDFPSGEQSCFGASNTSPLNSGSGLSTITYCFDTANGYETHHWYNVPSHVHGITTLGTYFDIYNEKKVGFGELSPTATLGVAIWGQAQYPAIANSTSDLLVFENGGLFPPDPPHYIGHLHAAPTDSNCKVGW
jgi:hypothetical protein